jgi:3-hydroxyisobutyrate dehydrogenase
MTISIGFVGLGSMGLPMAKQLLAAGHTVYGFDVAKPQLDAFRDAGGLPKPNPRAVADLVSLLILVVATAEQAEAALFGPDGGAAVLGEGGVVVLHSTVPPPFTEKLASRLHDMGLDLLDAPISGGRVAAEAGTLTVMASGSEAAFAAAGPALEAMAKTVHRLGDKPGVGSTVKMINQHLAGVHIAAACEAMALGTAAGADPQTLYEVITGSAGNSWMFTNRVPHILERDFTPLSAVEIFVKDLGIVLETARNKRFPLPLAAIAHQQFLAAAAAGLGREDDSAVVKVYEKLAGIEVRGRSKKG